MLNYLLWTWWRRITVREMQRETETTVPADYVRVQAGRTTSSTFVFLHISENNTLIFDALKVSEVVRECSGTPKFFAFIQNNADVPRRGRRQFARKERPRDGV